MIEKYVTFNTLKADVVNNPVGLSIAIDFANEKIYINII